MADMTGATRMAVSVRPQSAAGDVIEIDIHDEIGVDFWTGEGVTAKVVRDALKNTKPKTIKLSVNSGGGDTFEGVAIYNILRSYAEKGARIEGTVLGLAASAASVILAASDEVTIPANAAIMIHEAWTRMTGGAGDLEKRAALLRQVNDTAADTYVRSAQRRGVAIDRTDVVALMAAETWMFGEEAVTHGFADNVSDALEVAASVDLSQFSRAAEMRARLPLSALTRSPENSAMPEPITTVTESEPVAQSTQDSPDARAALELAQKAERERDAALERIAALEAERDLVRASAAEQAAETARLAADINRREVVALVGKTLYPAELEPMVELRAKDPELFSALMAARPSITLTNDVTGSDKPENSLTTDPDSKLAALVRDAGKDE
jgi:ATP-dependent protease ClpP protease subunit